MYMVVYLWVTNTKRYFSAHASSDIFEKIRFHILSNRDILTLINLNPVSCSKNNLLIIGYIKYKRFYLCKHVYYYGRYYCIWDSSSYDKWFCVYLTMVSQKNFIGNENFVNESLHKLLGLKKCFNRFL